MGFNCLFLKRSIIALSAILLSLSTLMSQSNKKKELQKEYSNILREITTIQKNIDKTSKERSIGVYEIGLLNKKIEKNFEKCFEKKSKI